MSSQHFCVIPGGILSKIDVLKAKCDALAQNRRKLYFALEALAKNPTEAEAKKAQAVLDSIKRPQIPYW